MTLLATLNAIAVLVSVWLLAGGKTREGNWVGLAASFSGAAVTALAGLQPMTAMNLILLTRFIWVLYYKEETQ